MKETYEKLDDIIAKYKADKNKKISSEDRIDAEHILELLLSDRAHWNKGFSYLYFLPPRIGAESIVKSLKSFDEDITDLFFDELSTNLNLAKNTAYPLQAVIIDDLYQRSRDRAFKLFVNLCEKATENSTKIPGTKVASMIDGLLQKQSGLLKTPLEHCCLSEHEFSSVTLACSAALFQKNKEHDGQNDYRFNILHWLVSSTKKATIPTKLKKTIESETLNWHEDLKRILVELGLLVGWKEISSTVTTESKINQIQPSKRNEEDSIALTRVLNKNEILIQLNKYLDELELRNITLERDVIKLKNDLDSKIRKQDALEDKIKSYENKCLEYEGQVKDLKTMLSTLQIDYADSKRILMQKEDEFKNNLGKLIDMSEQESSFASEEFKRKLSGRLKNEYGDFREIQSDAMTMQLGDNLRSQLMKVFQILQREGIQL